jgi:hypothetical protein
MSRRCYLVRMDARCPEPAGRTGFRHGRIKEYVSSNRSKILAAVLTLARAWYAAGKPKSSVPLIGSFEVWTETIAGILAHAGVEGFLANREELLEQRDMQVVDWAVFLKAIHDTFASSEFSIAELWDRLSDRPPGSPVRSGDRSFTPTANALRQAVPGDLIRFINREGEFKQNLGMAFAKRRGKRFGKIQLYVERGSINSHEKVARWRVVAGA